MTFFTNILNVNLDLSTLSFGVAGGLTCFIIGLTIKNIWFTNKSINSPTIIETPTTDTGIDTIRALESNIPSPTTIGEPNVYQFTADQLRSMQSMGDQLANLNSSSTLNIHSSSRILESWDSGTHTILYPDLNVQMVENTTNLMDLVNAGRLDQLNNVFWASTPNTLDIINTTSQVLQSAALS